eukprot:CAMPEP_0170497682 /NCGR_PEP_ID=MMETSP0208-20121228/25425_1 /TAXON_ID=197538 /ORGANISM="Strombidium inclinatum, Strain S3" /LENGTH=53 /DNA_ID=CAMNT_0010774573 /DNA_START=233 /DNA_END=394 /DNA_ORIENTATION=+
MTNVGGETFTEDPTLEEGTFRDYSKDPIMSIHGGLVANKMYMDNGIRLMCEGI